MQKSKNNLKRKTTIKNKTNKNRNEKKKRKTSKNKKCIYTDEAKRVMNVIKLIKAKKPIRI